MARILIVGSNRIYSIENFYVKYFIELGVELYHFPAQGIFYDYYEKSVTNKIIFKIGYSKIYKEINNRFIDVIEAFEPEIIWVFKGMEIFPESLHYAKRKKIKLVNYNPDNPFIFTGSGSGNENIGRSINLYDMHLTYNLQVRNAIQSLYGIPTFLLPFGYNISEELYKTCLNGKEIIRVCFLGNPDSQRRKFVNRLIDHGVALDLYGTNWKKCINYNRVNVFDPVYGDEIYSIYRKYRVQLNIMRIHNTESHNMRTFEVPGIGGIQLAPDTPDHRTYFNPGSEIFLYKSIEDCVQQIKTILAFTKEDSNQIRINARNRSIHSDYSYKDRARNLLFEFNKL